MQVVLRGFAAGLPAILLATIVLGLGGLHSPDPLAASGPSQGREGPPEFTGRQCAFWLDYDNDGEGDEALPTMYILQETNVVGGCDFRLNAPEEATIIVGSELVDWEVEVEIKREPGASDDYQMYPGRTEIPGIQGSMRIIANLTRGYSPRSVKVRTLRDGYHHEVQIPEEFRLLEIMVTTPDGKRDRLEQNIHSASGAYITAYREVTDPGGDLPEWVIVLAQEWLEEGYPQIASSIVTREAAAEDRDSGGPGWWKWAAIATWIAAAAVLVSALAAYVLMNRTPRVRPSPPGVDSL